MLCYLSKQDLRQFTPYNLELKPYGSETELSACVNFHGDVIHKERALKVKILKRIFLAKINSLKQQYENPGNGLPVETDEPQGIRSNETDRSSLWEMDELGLRNAMLSNVEDNN